METHATHLVSEISPGGRAAVEQLLGHPLQGDEQLFIMAFTPRPGADGRSAARARLEQFLSSQVRQAAVSAAEADNAILEAMQHERGGRY